MTGKDFHYFFFFNDTATTEIYTLSLHDALPIYARKIVRIDGVGARRARARRTERRAAPGTRAVRRAPYRRIPRGHDRRRSEEHTSELQSPCNLVCRLLLEKKKK